VFVGTCVLLFIWAGVWQLNRLSARRESNALIRSRETSQPLPMQDVVPVDATSEQIAANAFRRVTLTVTYLASDEVLIINRTNNGAPGFWVVTPLELADGTAVVVNRGWIPLPFGDGGSPDVYRPPSGPVTVTGLVLETQRQEGLGVPDPPEGTLDKMARVDVPRLQKQVDERLHPAYVNLVDQQPAQGKDGPFAVPPPELDDGPHLNYAGQWFLFATMTCIVYPLLLRRTARHKEIEARERELGGADVDTELESVS
jgi:cytochrome oxidase assembly protein ShyY1